MSSCLVCALRFPDSSISSDPCFSTTDGSPEVSTPAIEVAPLSSNAAAAVCRHVGLRRLELGVGVVQPHPHLGQPGLRGGQLLAGLIELLADLVELGGELVDLGLDLADGRLRRRVGAGGEDREQR